MIDLLLSNQFAVFLAINSVSDYSHKAEIQKLNAKIQGLENKAAYFEQRLIFEQRKNAELKGKLQ